MLIQKKINYIYIIIQSTSSILNTSDLFPFFVKILLVSLLSFVNILPGIIKHFMLHLTHLSKNLFHAMVFHILLTSTFKLQFYGKLWFSVVSQVQYITSMIGWYKLHLPNIIWKVQYCVDFCLEVRIANSAAGKQFIQVILIVIDSL